MALFPTGRSFIHGNYMDSGFGRTMSDQSQIHAFGQHKKTNRAGAGRHEWSISRTSHFTRIKVKKAIFLPKVWVRTDHF